MRDGERAGGRKVARKGRLAVVFFALPVMGNTQSGYTLTRTAATLDSFISELGPEIVYEKRYVLYALASIST
jgi:hypothetical protein